MNKVILIYEAKAYEDFGFVEVWLKVTDNEWFTKHVPIDLASEFKSIGKFQHNESYIMVDVLKEVFRELGIVCIEHAISDD